MFFPRRPPAGEQPAGDVRSPGPSAAVAADARGTPVMDWSGFRLPADWRRSGGEWRGACPVTGVGKTKAWAKPDEDLLGCRECAPGGLHGEEFKEHAAALGVQVGRGEAFPGARPVRQVKPAPVRKVGGSAAAARLWSLAGEVPPIGRSYLAGRGAWSTFDALPPSVRWIALDAYYQMRVVCGRGRNPTFSPPRVTVLRLQDAKTFWPCSRSWPLTAASWETAVLFHLRAARSAPGRAGGPPGWVGRAGGDRRAGPGSPPPGKRRGCSRGSCDKRAARGRSSWPGCGGARAARSAGPTCRRRATVLVGWLTEPVIGPYPPDCGRRNATKMMPAANSSAEASPCRLR